LGFRDRLDGYLKNRGVDISDTHPTYSPHISIAHIPFLATLKTFPMALGSYRVERIALVSGDKIETFPLLSDGAMKHLQLWREKAVRKGGTVEFVSDLIPVQLYTKIHSGLSELVDPQPSEIKTIFSPYL
jgi:hypothetical protein